MSRPTSPPQTAWFEGAANARHEIVADTDDLRQSSLMLKMVTIVTFIASLSLCGSPLAARSLGKSSSPAISIEASDDLSWPVKYELTGSEAGGEAFASPLFLSAGFVDVRTVEQGGLELWRALSRRRP